MVYVFLCLTYSTQYDTLSSIHVAANAWASELSAFSGSPQSMAEQGGGTNSWPFQPNVGSLSLPVFASELHVSSAETVRPVPSLSEGCFIQSWEQKVDIRQKLMKSK